VKRVKAIMPLERGGFNMPARHVNTSFRYIKHVLRSEGKNYLNIFAEITRPRGRPLSSLFGSKKTARKHRAARQRRQGRRRRR
jgi:hypothetical protein